MWTHASLCQLASELGNGHRHVLYRCSFSLFALQKAFAIVVISLSPYYQENTFSLWSEIFIRIINWSRSPVFDLFPLLFGFLCLGFSQLCMIGLLNYETVKNVYFYFCARNPSSFLRFTATWGKRCPWQPFFQFINMTHRHKIALIIRILHMSRDSPSLSIIKSPPRQMNPLPNL